VTGETTWSYLSRLAERYGMEPAALLPWWTWSGSGPRCDLGPRNDAEVLLNPAGRQPLMARALPAFAPEQWNRRSPDTTVEPQPCATTSPNSRNGPPDNRRAVRKIEANDPAAQPGKKSSLALARAILAFVSRPNDPTRNFPIVQSSPDSAAKNG
jgi:hypothetical protein